MTVLEPEAPAPSQRSLLREIVRLLRPFWKVAVFATIMGALSGLSTAWLLATVNRALHAAEGVRADGMPADLLLSFAALCVLIVAGEIASDLGNGLVGQNVVAGLRADLSQRILSAPIAEIERFRAHRITTVLNQDIDTISTFTFGFSSLAIAAAVTLGCFAYLALLSPPLCLIVAVAIALGSWAHAFARRLGRRGFEAARQAQDELQGQYRAITEGAKELRIDRRRRRHVRDAQLMVTIERIRSLRVRAMRVFMSANAFGSVLFFAVIGLVLHLQGRLPVDAPALSGFVIVLLYVKGPLAQLIGALPLLGQAQVAMRRVAELSLRFSSPESGLSRQGTENREIRAPRSIDMRRVAYSYPAGPGASRFTLGPIDLRIRAGEMLFLVGDNGSGKTTLIKLLLGLYDPQEGVILMDGEPVVAGNRDDYRQLFGTVFSDYYLFDDVVVRPGREAEAAAYLDRLELGHKVSLKAGRFSTLDLSTGQRKRLALVHAYLDKRPILVFDEWAADQDPAFRQVFYTEILPELKRSGRTLVVISHDDRYFHVADRVVHLADGRIVEDAAAPELVR
ncbi:cyclic peptide export ABC transporter [Castellaniella defragrans]|uniref:Putative ATP-binding cassette transporter n=1 Tax=Castellaniella defragrans TaxID=75697 RepID=A0A7W9TNS7_CASDE|nr:cyclic peptide export ABC transporter [Castellaniella defragrans]KAB0623571.1 cyclic peptide export ABC transporter [Castellaniella defragrans]MBB6083939.1 putative ATP-binding cassette transporter [Castellaniella defragrans]